MAFFKRAAQENTAILSITLGIAVFLFLSVFLMYIKSKDRRIFQVLRRADYDAQHRQYEPEGGGEDNPSLRL